MPRLPPVSRKTIRTNPFVAPSVPAETGDSTDFSSYEYNGEATKQLLMEYWTSFSTNNHDDSFVQTPAADSVYAPPSASFQERNQDDPFTQISATDNRYTPPQSTEDTSLPFEPSEGTNDSHVRGHRRTRRSTRAADPVEGPKEGDHNSKSRRKSYG
jgi:hypothetical protein